MEILFHIDAWADYLHFQKNDIKILEKINELIKDISRSSFTGLGKPENLKYDLSGYWSRRINHEHRFVYTVKDKKIYILQCRYHY